MCALPFWAHDGETGWGSCHAALQSTSTKLLCVCVCVYCTVHVCLCVCHLVCLCVCPGEPA